MSDGSIDLRAEAQAKAYAMPLEDINLAEPLEDINLADTELWHRYCCSSPRQKRGRRGRSPAPPKHPIAPGRNVGD